MHSRFGENSWDNLETLPTPENVTKAQMSSWKPSHAFYIVNGPLVQDRPPYSHHAVIVPENKPNFQLQFRLPDLLLLLEARYRILPLPDAWGSACCFKRFIPCLGWFNPWPLWGGSMQEATCGCVCLVMFLSSPLPFSEWKSRGKTSSVRIKTEKWYIPMTILLSSREMD